MKSIIKTSLGVLPIVLFMACGPTGKNKDTKHNTNQTDSTMNNDHTYACPMHPEMTGKKGDTCPTCGMNLEPVHVNNAPPAYGMDYNGQGDPVVDEAFILSFTPKIKNKPVEKVKLEVVHEQKIHLIIVSKDLSSFSHLHPVEQADGSYQVPHVFKAGGEYMMFTDYTPAGGKQQVDKISLTVTGTAGKEVVYQKEKLSAEVGGYTVSLEPVKKKWVTNEELHVKTVFKKNGKIVDVNSFDNYLGEKAHVVMIKTETYEFLHVHPMVKDEYLGLHVNFEKAGIYRGWLEFKINGNLHTADFVIHVEQGSNEVKTGHSGH